MNYLGFNTPEPTPIYEDNEATITVSNDERSDLQILHVDLRHFYILDWVKNGGMILKSIASANNPADELTKHLGPIFHGRHTETMLGKRTLSYW